MYIKLYCITTAFQIPCDELKLNKMSWKNRFFQTMLSSKI